ncbi:HpcH/HpaI aldolase/citrate lyase family protein [Corynebacterium sanguinis]|uniref:HpcH/HpaI aldolase/citrate lyase family protein n=1 Tax=Corynebacterium sanguinis TaxID=2594913 RepID=UPI0010A9ABED|nr:CoA ester lyase [Corynebacterium sanguinis]MCT1613166.1 CoA ester lyase [Corynebacterium sanguinis]MCT1695538.1 CoA ester lyase [Corynebacterium sanguinis]MCT1714946.1 CoA ester lyase [Corynebacterium sanguinis]MCT1805468.1 CoA ester lyase [Corynebacterium sanguinis]MCT2158441.1 CoA ester lyase [Corynebacterium sanguinis]
MSTGWLPAGPALLFTPADRADRFATALERADMVILDLEDGCRPENKQAARENIAASGLDPARAIVRVNPSDSEHFAEDVAAVSATAYRQVMLPKVESASDVSTLVDALPDAQVIALIETPRGVLRADEIAAHEGVVAMFWGAEDLTAGLGGSSSRRGDGTYRDVPRAARAWVQLAAAANGKAALDSVYVNIGDLEGLRAEATDAAALGYAATVCIHPSQVAVIRQEYRPSDDEAEWARRLLAEAENNRGAFAFEGRMVDEPLFRQAQSIARRAASKGKAN